MIFQLKKIPCSVPRYNSIIRPGTMRKLTEDLWRIEAENSGTRRRNVKHSIEMITCGYYEITRQDSLYPARGTSGDPPNTK
jgi:hypothetical protein